MANLVVAPRATAVSTPTRRLATIMFTDMVGYSALTLSADGKDEYFADGMTGS